MIREIGKELGQKEMFLELRSGTGIHTVRCSAARPSAEHGDQ